MHIAALQPDASPNAEYRVILPLRELQRRGHRVDMYRLEDLRDVRPLLEADVVYAWRLYTEAFLRVARAIAEAGGSLVWDNDDDLTSLEVRGRANHKFYSGLSGRQHFARMTAVMRCARLVTTPSRALAERYAGAAGVDVRVIENYVESVVEVPKGTGARRGLLGRRSRPASPTSERVVVGWVAHLEHQTDMERLRLRETMQRVHDENEHVEVVSIGCGLGLSGDRYRHLRRVPFDELATHIAEFDLGLAPIVDIPFNRARSSIKVKEYAAAGVPWLASPIGPYQALGERQGGRLVADDVWGEAVTSLVRDASAREKLAERAVRWGASQTIVENGHVWEQALSSAERHRDPTARAQQ